MDGRTDSDETGRLCPAMHSRNMERRPTMLPVAIRRHGHWLEPASTVAREFERLFRNMLESPFPEGDELTGAYPVDIREEDGNLIVEAEMPGFKREEIDVSLDQGVLNIRAERKCEETKGKKHVNERRFTRVQRSFTLPTPIDEAEVEAKLEDGVLRLRLPKTADSQAKKIEVS
jgi:HSP20 family protein